MGCVLSRALAVAVFLVGMTASAQAATISATVTGSGATGSGQSFANDPFSFSWSWDEATGAVQSASLTITDPHSGSFNSYSSGPLTIVGSSLVKEFNFFRWEITVSGGPTGAPSSVFGGYELGQVNVSGVTAPNGSAANPGFGAFYGNIITGAAGRNVNPLFTDNGGATYRTFGNLTSTSSSVSTAATVPLPASVFLLAGGIGLLASRRMLSKTKRA